MNRCLVLALVVVLVSSGVNELHDAMDSFVEETGIRSFLGSLQDGSITTSITQWSSSRISFYDIITKVCCCCALRLNFSLWDNLMWWWGSEEVGLIRRRKKPIGSKTILKPKPKV